MEQKKQKTPKNPQKSVLYFYAVMLLLIFLFNMVIVPKFFNPTSEVVTYNKFIEMLNDGKLAQVEVRDEEKQIVFTVNGDDKKVYITSQMDDPDLTNRLLEHDVDATKIWPEPPSMFLTTILPLAIMIGLGVWMSRSLQKRMSAGAMTFGKSGAKIYAETETGKTFADVAGQDEAKEALTEIVDFLHNPEKYASIGARLPKGALLVGPPGTCLLYTSHSGSA